MANLHVSIVGCGAVGVAIASSILHRKLATRLSFFDINAEKAVGEALDFAHASSLLGNVEVDGRGMHDVDGGDLCIITAGVKQRPGETRTELLQRNREALSVVAESLERGKLPRIALLVTNPVDAMTQALQECWKSNDVAVFGSGTLLDTLRFRADLAKRFEVSGESVHAYVVGEHGDSSVAMLDSATIGGLPLAQLAGLRGMDWEPDLEWDAAQERVRRAAYRVIQYKGATCHAIGVASARIAEAIAHDQHAVLPVSVAYKGVCVSLPSSVNARGAQLLGEPNFSTREREAFEQSVAALRRTMLEPSGG